MGLLEKGMIERWEDMQDEGCDSSIKMEQRDLCCIEFMDGVHAMGYREGYKQAEAEWDKKIDEMIAEIEKSKWINKYTRLVKNCNASGLEVALKIIHKYCDKERNND